MVSKSPLVSAYFEVQQQIHQASVKANRDPKDVRLICASKGHDAGKVRELMNAVSQQVDFGENYAQELSQKAQELADPKARWHFIGRLQSNKIKQIVQAATEIQTVESFKHATIIAKCAKELGKLPYPIYLSVNAGEEAQKSGLSWQDLETVYQQIKSQLPELKIMGIMALPPSTYQDPEADLVAVPALYQKLKQVSLKIGEGKLSLGMSSDLKIAIAAGATCIRIGTAIFGKRA